MNQSNVTTPDWNTNYMYNSDGAGAVKLHALCGGGGREGQGGAGREGG